MWREEGTLSEGTLFYKWSPLLKPTLFLCVQRPQWVFLGLQPAQCLMVIDQKNFLFPFLRTMPAFASTDNTISTTTSLVNNRIILLQHACVCMRVSVCMCVCVCVFLFCLFQLGMANPIELTLRKRTFRCGAGRIRRKIGMTFSCPSGENVSGERCRWFFSARVRNRWRFASAYLECHCAWIRYSQSSQFLRWIIESSFFLSRLSGHF